MATHRDYRTLTNLSLGLRPLETGHLSKIIPHNHGVTIKYSTFLRGISVYSVCEVGMFSEAEGRGEYSLPRMQYMAIFHKEGF